MALPDVIVKVLSALTPKAIPTNTAVAFVVGEATRGWQNKPRLLKSMSDFIAAGGARLTTSPLYDWIETFFNEGGAEVYWARVIGSGAVTAKLELKNAAEQALVVEAGSLGQVEPGTWGNELKVAVVAVTGGYALQVSNAAGLLEESPKLVTQLDAVAWANANSKNIVVTVGTGTQAPAVAAAAALTTGANGSATTDANFATAWALMPKELGPGQAAAPGQTTQTRQEQVINNAVTCNRYAVLDAANTHTVATLVAAAQALYTTPGPGGVANQGRRYAELLAPWEVIPGLTPTTTRTVPPSARKCAQYAKVDKLGNPNRPAAGKQGEANYVIDLSQAAWTDAERLELNNAGVTVSRRRFGNAIVTYGLRNLADQINDSEWSFAAGVRCLMAFAAEAEVIGANYELDQIDGFGHAQSDLGGALTALCLRYFTKGALYGKTALEAFAVNTSDAINTTQTIAEGKLIAQVGLKVSPGAEQTIVNIYKVPITQELNP